MQKYQYFKWSSTFNLDGFRIITFQYIICESFRYWKERLTKLDVNLWEIWQKFKCRWSMSYPAPVTRILGSKRPPIFSAAVTQWPHIFADCLCCHPKTQQFLVKCELFNRSHLKTPYFLHSTATGSYFLFQFHWQIDHFCHFWQFSLQIPAFKVLTERLKVTFSPNAPNFEPKFGFSPNDPSFLRLCSYQMPQPLEVWALHP